jgi:hypothetical protein
LTLPRLAAQEQALSLAESGRARAEAQAATLLLDVPSGPDVLRQ